MHEVGREYNDESESERESESESENESESECRVSAMRLPFPLVLFLASACASAPPYARCDGNTSCAMGSCTELSFTRSDGTNAHGSFCTNECHADADCPDEGACLELAHDPTRTFFCVKRCATSTDCSSPLACTNVVAPDGTTFGACLP